jgi:preprotein translocase subunit SecE
MECAVNPAKFAREVRQEAKRVVWPTRKETTVSTVMVLVLALVSCVFFVLADSVIGFTVRAILGMGE